jgi:hypothetical protein
VSWVSDSQALAIFSLFVRLRERYAREETVQQRETPASKPDNSVTENSRASGSNGKYEAQTQLSNSTIYLAGSQLKKTKYDNSYRPSHVPCSVE